MIHGLIQALDRNDPLVAVGFVIFVFFVLVFGLVTLLGLFLIASDRSRRHDRYR
jgi:hypothetical protein